VKLTTANLFDYNKPPIDIDRQDRQRAAIRAARPDVLCLQEFWHATRDPDDPALADAFAEFCDGLGMECCLAYARSFCHVGVLRRADVASLVSWQEYGRWQWHHALGMAELEIGAVKTIRVATAQLHPADPAGRFAEADYVAMAGLGNPELITSSVRTTTAPVASRRCLDSPAPSTTPEPYRGQVAGLPHQQFQVEWNDDSLAEPSARPSCVGTQVPGRAHRHCAPPGHSLATHQRASSQGSLRRPTSRRLARLGNGSPTGRDIPSRRDHRQRPRTRDHQHRAWPHLNDQDTSIEV
jgi:hypothetical protein